jgi:hypothetical protein
LQLAGVERAKLTQSWSLVSLTHCSRPLLSSRCPDAQGFALRVLQPSSEATAERQPASVVYVACASAAEQRNVLLQKASA